MGYGYYYGFDLTYIVLVLPAVLLALLAQANVKSTFNKYSKVISSRRITGEQAARRLLDSKGLYNVRILRVAGNLTDNYDPRSNTVNLSQSVYDSCSVAAIGVACHETGHAIQHAEGYVPVKIRTAIVPVTQIASNLAMPMVIIGLIFSMVNLAYLGCIFFGVATFFQLVTLPVEFNASKRALNLMVETGILGSDEVSGAKKTLTAAALTYVAALAVSLVQLLRLLLIVGERRNRR